MNVISLFNGFIPLVAIQMQAFRLGDQITLLFTTVLDQLKLGLVDEDEEVAEVTDRDYWEKRGSKATLETTDQLLGIVREIEPGLALKYNKFYIGLARDGQPNNFVIFRPKKEKVSVEPRLPRLEETEQKLEEAGLHVMPYEVRWGRMRVQVSKGDIDMHRQLLKNLIQQAHESG